jgi:hypothetical protein
MASVEIHQEGSKPTVKIVAEDCKKTIGFGQPEDLSRQLIPAKRHFNGARAAELLEREYNGGRSVVDRADRE